jgi:hypothetical protein
MSFVTNVGMLIFGVLVMRNDSHVCLKTLVTKAVITVFTKLPAVVRDHHNKIAINQTYSKILKADLRKLFLHM